jgi:hypothetical protein
MDYLLLIVLLLCFTIGPVVLLRLLFRKAEWHWVSSHPTTYAFIVISLVWLSLFAAAYLSYQRYGFHPYSHAGPLHTDSHDPASAALEEAVNRLKEGRIAFDVPREMKEQKQERVEVRIARGVTVEVEQRLKEKMRSTAQVEEIKVADFMIVELKDADGSTFTITPLTQDRQSVAGHGYTNWVWIVTPLRSGQQSLYLSVGTRFQLPYGHEEVRFVPIYQKDIIVRVDRIYETKHFLFSNWQWLSTTLAIPIIVFLWQHRRKRRRGTTLLP